MPRAVASAITDNRFSLREWTTATGLSRLSDDDKLRIPTLADRAQETLTPVNHGWLEKRLSTMYLAMAHDRDPDKATAWLHEFIRLLADLPQDIVAHSVDEAVKKSERGFLPSIGAIRAIADPMVEERQQKVRRLRMMADAILAPKVQIEQQPFERCPGDEATKIMDDAGISRVDPVKPRPISADRLRGPKSITVEDYVQLGLTRAAAEAAVAEIRKAGPEAEPKRARPSGSIGSHLPSIEAGA
ncbi:hypothetical protein [Sphingobium sp. TomTYG75]